VFATWRIGEGWQNPKEAETIEFVNRSSSSGWSIPDTERLSEQIWETMTGPVGTVEP
jgi:hypothetical protein